MWEPCLLALYVSVLPLCMVCSVMCFARLRACWFQPTPVGQLGGWVVFQQHQESSADRLTWQQEQLLGFGSPKAGGGVQTVGPQTVPSTVPPHTHHNAPVVLHSSSPQSPYSTETWSLTQQLAAQQTQAPSSALQDLWAPSSGQQSHNPHTPPSWGLLPQVSACWGSNLHTCTGMRISCRVEESYSNLNSVK